MTWRTPYSAWISGFTNGWRGAYEKLGLPYDGNVAQFCEEKASQDVLHFESLGILPEFTQGVEDGIADLLFDYSLLDEEPKCTRPPRAPGEDRNGCIGFCLHTYENECQLADDWRAEYIKSRDSTRNGCS